MFRIRSLTNSLRPYLAQRLGRLKTDLTDLGSRLRATVAARVADNVARVVQEVVEIALAEPEPDPVSPGVNYRNPPAPWDDAAHDPPSFQPSSREDLFGGYPSAAYAEEDDEIEPTPSSPSGSSAALRLRSAMSTGLQASAWCLRRRGPVSLLTALAVGVSAGAVALFGSPLLAAGAATIGSLLALAG